MAAIEYLNDHRQITPTPEQAIVIHRAGTSFLATHHELSQRGKSFVLGQARALSDRTLNEIVKAVQNRVCEVELIPEHLLYQQQDVMVWFRPASQRRVWFRRDGEPTALDVSLPPLIYRTNGKAIFVAALASSARPMADTRLFHAPVANVHTDTALCHGNADLPVTSGPSTIDAWEGVLWQTNFTVFHQPFLNRRSKRSTSFSEYKGLMNAMRSSNSRWTSSKLLPLSLTLREWINGDA